MANFLKRLELTGFKSFAQKAVFEFPSGITAIVGPNGSGKSNVVDAIRWLLGEREARNLRGAKVEDLIFAGTPQRARLGIAQAALHFENKNNFFPVEFAEVSIMRQISRDGTSRYFLNKSEVLLRDLVDFLAKARLGSKGMTVVTQGNSDMFIRAAPKERREMIEEVLGLREYQLKKLDAERRLKNSRINLDKAKALTEEILPHLRSLKRQTSRWEKRGELEEELRILEDLFFGGQLHEIESGLSEALKKIKAGEQEIAVLEKEKKVAEERQREVEQSQPEERETLKKIKAETQELLEKRRQLEKDLGRLEAQIEMSAKSAAGPSSGGALDLIKNIREELKSGLAGDFVELRAAVESALERINDWIGGGKKEEKRQVPQELEARFKKINQELSDIEGTMRALEAEEQKLERGQEEFYKSFKSAVREVEAAKEKIEKRQMSHKEVVFEKERLELRREELLRQIEQAGRKKEELEAMAKAGATAAPEDRQIMERKIFKLRGDLASIGDIDEALMKEARETESRYEFLKKESEDLGKAVTDLERLISDLNEKIHAEFEKSLVKINEEFNKFFNLMFGGGQAKLKIEQKSKIKNQNFDEEDEESIDESSVGAEEDENVEEEAGGVLISLKLPRKKINSLEVLSGGERSLVGIAAIFAMISVSPPPFLVLDEIDAPLDDRNARRFAEMLKEFSKRTQFVIVTHNRATMEAADVLYGVTLNEDGTSKLVSLKLE